MKTIQPSYLIGVFFLSVIYFLTARFGLELGAVSEFATLVWLPSGISLTALFIFGHRYWPGIAIGAFFANLVNDASLMVALGISIGNTLEAVVGVYILKRFTMFRGAFNSLIDVAALFAVSIVAPMISASVGVTSLLLGGIVSFPTFTKTWFAWWVGDAISILVITPFLIIWWVHHTITFQFKKFIEGALLLLATIIIALIIFRQEFGIKIGSAPITYVIFPSLIWASLRFGPRDAITMIVLISSIAVWGTVDGLSQFSRFTLNESLLYIHSFIGVISMTTLLLAAVLAERKNLEQQKDNLISFASHELKTPLTSVKAYVQILGRLVKNMKEKRAIFYVKNMSDQVNRLAHLVNDLLDVSKIEVGGLELRKTTFSLQNLIKETVHLVRQVNSKYKIVIRGLARRTIYGDEDRIGQVLINLLLNAIKYSPRARQIQVLIERHKDSITIGVKDFGIGIDPKYHEKIFEPFYRVAHNNDTTASGSGIGLYIAWSIVKKHGGTMWVKSKPGKGSTFYFSLPHPKA
jgi:signal transduction histidine kinase